MLRFSRFQIFVTLNFFPQKGRVPVTLELTAMRILARRQRIQERLDRQEYLNNLAAGMAPEPVETRPVSSIEVNHAVSTIKDNKLALEEFINQGQSILADVQIASNNNESSRRKEQEKQHKELLERLENEGRQEDEKFKEISAKWDLKTGKYKNHSDLYNLLNEQNDTCKLVINQKNKIITILKDAIKMAEESYVKDLKRENNDIELISKRMEAHVKDMQVKFAENLNKIQNTLLQDRTETLSKAINKSENSWKARTLREIEMIFLHLEDKDNYTAELDEIRDRGAEEYGIMRNKLERDVMTHEQQLQQMKAIYQLNQEKLHYNHEILRNREDENSIIKAQQKRKITKLQDNLNNLKIKMVKQANQQKSKESSMSEDYARIVTQTTDLENKIKHFENVDNKKFHDIWKMNFNTIKRLAAECLAADRIIHQHQLGIKWDRNIDKTWFVDTTEINRISGHREDNELDDMFANFDISVLANDPELAPWQKETIRKKVIINTRNPSEISASTDPEQVSPPGTAGSSSIIESTSSKTINDTESLIQQISENSNLSVDTIRKLLPLVAEEGDFLFEKKLAGLLRKMAPSYGMLVRLDGVLGTLGVEAEDDISLMVQHLEKHVKISEDGEMDINKVIPALRDFIKSHKEKCLKQFEEFRQFQLINAKKSLPLSGLEWAALDKKYWQEMADTIDQSKFNLWGGMEASLEKYYSQLCERKKLIDGNSSLKQQNTELKILLQKYLGGDVNRELIVPPTQFL